MRYPFIYKEWSVESQRKVNVTRLSLELEFRAKVGRRFTGCRKVAKSCLKARRAFAFRDRGGGEVRRPTDEFCKSVVKLLQRNRESFILTGSVQICRVDNSATLISYSF